MLCFLTGIKKAGKTTPTTKNQQRGITIEKKYRHSTDYFDRLSSKYDRQYSGYLKHIHQKMLKKLSMGQEDDVLDVSSGTGILAEAMINKFGPFRKMVVNDPSQGMLEQAKYRLRYQKGMEFTSDFSEKLSFRDDEFSQIICMNAFRYYEDHAAVLKHFRRLLRPGGRLWILSWDRTGYFKIVNKVITQLSGQEMNTRTLEEMKELLETAGFTVTEEERWSYRWWKLFFLKCV